MLAAFSVGTSLPVAAAKMLAAFSVGPSLPVAAAKTCYLYLVWGLVQ